MYTSSALENKMIPQPSLLIPKLSTTSHMDKKDPKLLQVHKNKVLRSISFVSKHDHTTLSKDLLFHSFQVIQKIIEGSASTLICVWLL